MPVSVPQHASVTTGRGPTGLAVPPPPPVLPPAQPGRQEGWEEERAKAAHCPQHPAASGDLCRPPNFTALALHAHPAPAPRAGPVGLPGARQASRLARGCWGDRGTHRLPEQPLRLCSGPGNPHPSPGSRGTCSRSEQRGGSGAGGDARRSLAPCWCRPCRDPPPPPPARHAEAPLTSLRSACQQAPAAPFASPSPPLTAKKGRGLLPLVLVLLPADWGPSEREQSILV